MVSVNINLYTSPIHICITKNLVESHLFIARKPEIGQVRATFKTREKKKRSRMSSYIRNGMLEKILFLLNLDTFLFSSRRVESSQIILSQFRHSHKSSYDCISVIIKNLFASISANWLVFYLRFLSSRCQSFFTFFTFSFLDFRAINISVEY